MPRQQFISLQCSFDQSERRESVHSRIRIIHWITPERHCSVVLDEPCRYMEAGA